MTRGGRSLNESRMKLARPALLAVVLFACACGRTEDPPSDPPTPPPPPPRPAVTAPAAATSGASTFETEGLAYAGLMLQLSLVYSINVNDCDKMGDALKEFDAKHHDEMVHFKNRGQAQTEEEKRIFEDKIRPKLENPVKTIRKGLEKCGSNPKVAAAIKAME